VIGALPWVVGWQELILPSLIIAILAVPGVVVLTIVLLLRRSSALVRRGERL
jgi:hypothetical protein